LNTVAGIGGAVLTGVLLAVRSRPQRRPILVSLITGLSLWRATTAALRIGKSTIPLPAIALPNLEGQMIARQSLAGRAVVINLWASWWPPCRREMSVLQEAQKAHTDVVFVFANQGGPAKVVQAYIDTEALLLKNVVPDQEGAIAKDAGAAGLPTMLCFDRNGQLVATRVGTLSEASLAQRIELLQLP
jgi:thiol-disulfide isomerase/thioredoxin